MFKAEISAGDSRVCCIYRNYALLRVYVCAQTRAREYKSNRIDYRERSSVYVCVCAHVKFVSGLNTCRLKLIYFEKSFLNKNSSLPYEFASFYVSETCGSRVDFLVLWQLNPKVQDHVVHGSPLRLVFVAIHLLKRFA